MKKCLIFVVLTFWVSLSFAQDKSVFDLNPSSLSKSLSGFGSVQVQNGITEITMISGGYFTIGTTEGVEAGELDDRCGITFGHPFAMTSYPVFSIDGDWYKPDDYFINPAGLAATASGDTLTVTAVDSAIFSFTFTIINTESSGEIEFMMQLENLDSVSHDFGNGLVFDPALGKWGDGALKLDNSFLKNDTLLNGADFDSLTIFERDASAKGLGIQFDFFQDKPTQIIAANWADVYQSPEPDFSPSLLRTLYDLLLKIHWGEESIAPGEGKTRQFSLKLLPPDFSSSAFLRWDLTSFLSIENNVMFPRKFTTFLEISPGSNASSGAALLNVDTLSYLTTPQNEFNISLENEKVFYQEIPFTSKIIYEDKIVDVSVRLRQNSRILDELHRSVFIPATPVSDTGLVVDIDTVDATQFPAVHLKFEVRNQATDYIISNLDNENVFLYENNNRVPEFSLRKDTTGGADAADIIFVLDVTGSMGNEIQAVRNNIIEFTDSLSRKGVDFRLGMVTFLDEIENVYDFTKDVQAFQLIVSQQYAHGGGDSPENSLAALLRASQFNFRTNAKRMIIWITDETYHEHDGVTNLNRQDVINSLLAADITVHSIGSQHAKSAFYDPIIIPTGGNYYNINGNFRDILIDISRFKVVGKYILSYTSANTGQNPNKITLKVHYAGLGGEKSIYYSHTEQSKLSKHLLCYPNPFNPDITLQVKLENYIKADVYIFNILGQCVKHFSLPKQPAQKLVWNARGQNDVTVGSGFYIIQLSLMDKQGRIHRESEKVLYLK